MTLIVLEGPSKSGKSTVRDKVLEEHSNWVMMKGENLMRKGHAGHWDDYQRRYHEMLHRLYELNPENVIVADRAFSDGAYHPDGDMRAHARRLYACYGDVYIMYFYPGSLDTDEDGRISHDNDGIHVLRERGSRDNPKMYNILKRYEILLEMFPHKHINTDGLTIPSAVRDTISQIEDWHEISGHNPDV